MREDGGGGGGDQIKFVPRYCSLGLKRNRLYYGKSVLHMVQYSSSASETREPQNIPHKTRTGLDVTYRAPGKGTKGTFELNHC